MLSPIAEAEVQLYHDEMRHHVLEVQLAENALVRTLPLGVPPSAASALAATHLRGACNDLGNLNVTSRRVNQSKRGPFTAALRRVRLEGRDGRSLRSVPLEQYARQGAARWLVDDGTWARIECEMRRTCENLSGALDTAMHEEADDGPWSVGDLSTRPVVTGWHREAVRIAEDTLEELDALLARLGVE